MEGRSSEEKFLMALAIKVAYNVHRNVYPLAVAPVLCKLFKVCKATREVSRSDLLWKHLTAIVWNHGPVDSKNWRNEYIYRHRTNINFYVRRYIHTIIPIQPPKKKLNEGHMCLRLALSNYYFAAGYSNGIVRLYEKASGARLGTFKANKNNDILGGKFTYAVTGIILNDKHIVFGTLDGYIYGVDIDIGDRIPHVAHSGDIYVNGCMIDFDGNNQWWVGLYVGVCGRAFHVWNGSSKEKIFVGGTLTDPELVKSWILPGDISNSFGRLRVLDNGIVTACTAQRAIEFKLDDHGKPLAEEKYKPNYYRNDLPLMFRCFDVTEQFRMLVHGSGWVSMRRNLSCETYNRSRVTNVGANEGVVGCMNNQIFMIYKPTRGGVIEYFRVHDGWPLSQVNERVDGVTALVADETHLLASTSTSFHMWSFGAQR